MNKKIALLNVGDVFTGFLIIKEVLKGTARNGKDYLSVTLADSSGKVKTMVWDSNEQKEAFFQPSKIVKVEGVIGEYQGNRQININRIRDTKEGEYNLSEIVETAPISGDSILPKIYDTIDSIQNEKIKKITFAIFKKHEENFEKYPAAKNVHHAYVGGLAYHTFSMLKLAKELANLYPILNKDLLFAGVILHDIKKINDYSFDGYTVSDMTVEGKLIGHIPMMMEEIGLTARELGVEGEEVILLQHMVGSHHGLHQNGWGSAVSPMIPEAEALHMIDMFDAKLEILKNAFENVESGEFTERLFGMDNRSFYKPKI